MTIMSPPQPVHSLFGPIPFDTTPLDTDRLALDGLFEL